MKQDSDERPPGDQIDATVSGTSGQAAIGKNITQNNFAPTIEAGASAVFLFNVGQSQPCPHCGDEVELAKVLSNSVEIPKTGPSLLDHQAINNGYGCHITATAICPNCKKAFDIEASAALFTDPEMTCPICHKSKYMKPCFLKSRLNNVTKIVSVELIVRCTHCRFLTSLLGLFSSYYRPPEKVVQLSPIPGVV